MPPSQVQRSMDDFLIHPTTVNTMDQCGFESSPSIPLTLHREVFASEEVKKSPTTPSDFKAFRDEPIYSRGYASEEELASPVDNDDFSIGFDGDADSLASYGDASDDVQICTAQQLCTQAQAVQVVSAGKAKVVSMPKLVDSPTMQSPPSSVMHSPIQTATFSPTQSYVEEETLSPSPSSWLSDESWPIRSTPFVRPEAPDNARTIRRRPNLPPLQLVPRSESPQELSSVPKAHVSSRAADFLDYGPRVVGLHPPTPSPIAPAKRRVYRLPSTFSLRALGKSLKRQSSGSDGGNSEPATSPSQTTSKVQLHAISDMHVPSRTSSKPMPKMVPRGASERAPPIVLPPCPYDAEDWESEEEPPKWPARSDSSTTQAVDVDTSFVVARSRRKSLPAYVSAQV